MDNNLDKCPECGYVNNNRPNVCPSCGYNLQKYREEVIEILRVQANEERIENDYKEAIKLFTSGDFTNAKIIFLSLNGYKDSASYLEQCIECQYNETIEEFKNFTSLYEFFSSKEHEYDNFKEIIQNHSANKNVEIKVGAIAKRFKDIEKYKDAKIYVETCKLFKTFLQSYKKEMQLLREYNEAYNLFETKKYEDATKILNELSNVNNFATIVQNAKDLLNKIKVAKKEDAEEKKAKEEAKKAQLEAERVVREKAEKKKKLIKIVVSLSVILAILVAIIIGVSSSKAKEESKYGASNITISVVSKTNGSQTYDGYTTNLKIAVTNKCTEKITYLKGSMIISTNGGIELWSGEVSLTGNVYGDGGTGSWNLELSGDSSELWNYNLTQLKIRFKITGAHFDGITKTYSEDYKIIYPKS